MAFGAGCWAAFVWAFPDDVTYLNVSNISPYFRCIRRNNLILPSPDGHELKRLFERGLSNMEVSAITGAQRLKRYTHLKAEDLAKNLARHLEVATNIKLVLLHVIHIAEQEQFSLA